MRAFALSILLLMFVVPSAHAQWCQCYGGPPALGLIEDDAFIVDEGYGDYGVQVYSNEVYGDEGYGLGDLYAYVRRPYAHPYARVGYPHRRYGYGVGVARVGVGRVGVGCVWRNGVRICR
jgi:hypothetical protein